MNEQRTGNSGKVGAALVGLSAAFLLVLAAWITVGPGLKGEAEEESQDEISSAWKSAPIVPIISGQLKRRLLVDASAGRKKGMRGDVFAKVGDSNTEMPGAYYGFTCTRAPLELPPSLSRMVSKFNRQPVANPDPLPGCRRETSFARHSVAARTGTLSFWPIYPITKMPDRGYWNKPEGCAQNQTPLDCELKATRPRYALIMSGTNDIGAAIYFRGVPGSDTSARVSRMITICRSYGVIPVISSLPRIFSDIPGDQAKFDKGVERANHDLFQLARKRKAPFVNIWRAMNEPQMVNSGIYDGLHLGIYGWSDPDQGTIPYPAAFTNSVIFTRKALRYGANRRNLIMLKTLARLDQAIG